MLEHLVLPDYRCAGTETGVVHDIPLSRVDLGETGSNLEVNLCPDCIVFFLKSVSEKKRERRLITL